MFKNPKSANLNLLVDVPEQEQRVPTIELKGRNHTQIIGRERTPKVSLPLTAIILVVILVATAIAGTAVYYNGLVNGRNQQIAALNQQIAKDNTLINNLTAQVFSLKTEITNLTTANLEPKLNVTEEPNNSDLVQTFPNIPVVSVPYNSLWINGSVINTGHVTAYNAGLHVIGYASDGAMEVNITVPLVADAVYGTDQTIDSLIINNPRLIVGNDIGALHFGQIGSFQLGSLSVGQTADIFLAIYHEGVIANWTVTPLWTNSL